MKPSVLAISAALAAVAAAPALAQNVKITPLGSHEGEFCRNDRAMVFEDPDGTRILYDAGRTVRGADDPRLGEIDAVLLSHIHGDHLGDAHANAADAGTCAEPDSSVKVTPASNTVSIAVGKGAKLLVGGEMASFLGKKVAGAGGTADQVQLVRFGGVREIGGVRIFSVPAVHSNGVSPEFLEGDHAEALTESGLTAYVGPPGGYVLEFSNGLTVYLSGDTGQMSEHETLIRRRFGAELAVMNIGGIFSTGPEEAAWVMNELVQPKSVIASHANEAATENGALKPDSKTAAFAEATNAEVHLPLSGRTMEFGADGTCVSGC